MYIHQFDSQCCYSMECLRKMWSCMRRSLHPSRYCVSCRLCQNSFCHFYQPPCAPEKKFLVEMGEESPGYRLEFWNSLLLEIMAKLMKMRGRRHTSRVRMSMLFVVLPPCRSPSLSCRASFSQRFSGKKLEGHTLSECVFDTARPPQSGFSKLHSLLAFGLLE